MDAVSGEFCFYAEPAAIVDEPNRQVHAGLGEVGGMTLAHLGVGKENVLLTVAELRRLTNVLEGMDTERPSRSSGYYLYRVEIRKYPEGALEFYTDGDESFGYPDPEWTPEGWTPDDEWVSRFGSTRFFWPSTKREYKSKSSAKARARLIEFYGAKAEVVQSSLITWPAVDPDVEVWR